VISKGTKCNKNTFFTFLFGVPTHLSKVPPAPSSFPRYPGRFTPGVHLRKKVRREWCTLAADASASLKRVLPSGPQSLMLNSPHWHRHRILCTPVTSLPSLTFIWVPVGLFNPFTFFHGFFLNISLLRVSAALRSLVSSAIHLRHRLWQNL
jgi:hypothetical protein